jgi:hypothetical protein
MKSFAIPALALTLALSPGAPRHVLAQENSGSAKGCAPVGDLQFVCDLINVEDFLPVERGRWLVGGSLKVGSVGLYLIDTATKTAKTVTLSIAAKADPIYIGCAAPDLKGLSTHGLDVVPGNDGTSTVYAVNHGGRESVEVFRLNAAQGKAEWIGCAVLPEGANGNSIAAVPTGGFVVTKFLDTRDKQDMQNVMAGKINGVVYRWQPGKGFSEVPGTQLSGDNGVVVSPDGKWVFVNAWGTLEIYRVPLSGNDERTSARVDFHPDNLRWAPDGKIFVTGQFIKPNEGLGAPIGWATAKLDPQTMAVAPFVKEPGYAQFDAATSGVQVGDTMWFGTFRGERMAYRAAP